MPLSRKPFANGLWSIFSCVICKILNIKCLLQQRIKCIEWIFGRTVIITGIEEFEEYVNIFCAESVASTSPHPRRKNHQICAILEKKKAQRKVQSTDFRHNMENFAPINCFNLLMNYTEENSMTSTSSKTEPWIWNCLIWLFHINVRVGDQTKASLF